MRVYIRNLLLKISRKCVWVAKIWSVTKYYRKSDASALVKIFEKYNVSIDNKKYLRFLYIDMQYSKIVYRVDFDEYFLFGFQNLNDEAKRTFVSDIERQELFTGLSSEETRKLFDNKYQTYCTFKDFYKRDVVLIDGEKDKDRFLSFASMHPQFIIKPLSSSFGKGVLVYDAQNKDSKIGELFFELLDMCPYIIEEKIVQANVMAEFHEQSCNTVRLATFYKNGNVELLFSFFRMGRGESIVDNAGAGGIFTSVDLNTGIVNSPGINEKNETFLKHPDTGKIILGFQIPYWDELCLTVKEMAKLVPQQPYVGWDMALTNEGWIVVEGNSRGQLVQQYAEKKGCREKLYQLVDSMK